MIKVPNRFSKSRRGYLLLTVVVMIAVASLLLGRIASTSLRIASLAQEEERELRCRWAIDSLRRYTLASAPLEFATEDNEQQPDRLVEVEQPTRWRDVNLAGQRWKIILADESAKIDVARIALRFGRDKARGLMDELLVAAPGIRPNRDVSLGRQSSVGRWENWLVDDDASARTATREIALATRNMTLWGDGRLNVLRCEPDTLDKLWRLLFDRNAPDTLHENRLRRPAQSIDVLINSLALRESQANLARQWLTTQGNCFSIWIFCESDRRVGSSFAVEWGGAQHAKVFRVYEY